MKMALFYGHAPAAGHAPCEEERDPSTQMVDRELVVSNEQESQAWADLGPTERGGNIQGVWGTTCNLCKA